MKIAAVKNRSADQSSTRLEALDRYRCWRVYGDSAMPASLYTLKSTQGGSLTATATLVEREEPGPPGQRGPAEHERRHQILAAANEHFRSYGYTKTTVADLAKAIGLSAAYIYKFFNSKQAIGEAVCRQSLGAIAAELHDIVKKPQPAATRLRLVFKTVARRGAELCFNERNIFDLAVTACTEKWPPVRDHQAALLHIIRDIIIEGREAGEFERKTPIAETSLAVLQTLELFSQPLFLAQNIPDPESKAENVANLVLRSLAP